MENLQRITESLATLDSKILEPADKQVAVGNQYLSKDADICTVTAINVYEKGEGDYDRWPDKARTGELMIVISYEYHYHGYKELTKKSEPLPYFMGSWGDARITKNIDLLRAEAKAMLDGGDTSQYMAASEGVSDDQGLVQVKSAEYYEGLMVALDDRRNHALVVARLAQQIIETQRRNMESMVRALNHTVAVFNKQIKRIMQFVHSIELYLGVNEEIFQLQEGETASADEPVCFRQQLLYMDEEVASVEDGGLDYTNINVFDEWLLKDNNYEMIIPEKKGVVALRVRRINKDYGDKWDNLMKNQENRRTYFLIRNGDNLYRIWADMIVYSRLFPKRNELQETLTSMQGRGRGDSDDVQDILQRYKRQIMVLQGLMDRSTVFHPMTHQVKLLQWQEGDLGARFIYDDENLLPTGRKSFKQWKDEVNEGIERGSRIIHTGFHHRDYARPKDYRDRYLKWYEHDMSIPALPRSGLYTVEAIPGQTIQVGISTTTGKLIDIKYNSVERGEGGKAIVAGTQNKLFIKYVPADEIYKRVGYYVEEVARTNRISFRIEKDDPFILHYDHISLEDVEFYLKSRVDRSGYLDMMPVLRQIKAMRLAEIEWEKMFVDLAVNEIKKELPTESQDIKAVVWAAVDWWKHKNIWKRPITKDDAKALRMIKSRVRRHFKLAEADETN